MTKNVRFFLALINNSPIWIGFDIKFNGLGAITSVFTDLWMNGWVLPVTVIHSRLTLFKTLRLQLTESLQPSGGGGSYMCDKSAASNLTSGASQHSALTHAEPPCLNHDAQMTSVCYKTQTRCNLVYYGPVYPGLLGYGGHPKTLDYCVLLVCLCNVTVLQNKTGDISRTHVLIGL